MQENKILKVIEPFFTLSVGDELELSRDGNFYAIEKNEEYDEHNTDKSKKAIYNSSLTISKDYAEELIHDGFLEDKISSELDKPFVNIFDEIDDLISRYTSDLHKTESDKGLHPAIKHEAVTVYNNLISVLEHLKALKK